MEKHAKKKDVEFASNRRSFLTRLWVGFGAVALAEIAWVLVSFLRPRKSRAKEDSFESVLEAGAVESFEPGTVTAFPRGNFYLARLEDGGFLALSRTCTHLGCTVPWVQAEARFVCPCHSSTFDIAGNVIAPPATRALDLFRIAIENNVITVDTRRRIRRTEFRKDQVVYPKEI
jgi:cytochrome b6-f complex iron-sulfur subunit